MEALWIDSVRPQASTEPRCGLLQNWIVSMSMSIAEADEVLKQAS